MNPVTLPPAVEADAIARLVRTRRLQRGWSLAKLAAAAGLQSPAYVFHIENGSKTPREPVARRLAAALGLDPELLAAWSQARHRADLPHALAAAERVQRWLAGRAPGAGEEAAGERGADAGVAGAYPALRRGPLDEPVTTDDAPPYSADTLAVPVLPEGADPDATGAHAIETLRLPLALFPPLPPGARVAAYRLSAHGARRAADALRPGDCVVLLLGGEPAAADALVATRAGGRIEIARAAAARLPAHGGAADDPAAPAPATGAIVGRVVLVFRRWL